MSDPHAVDAYQKVHETNSPRADMEETTKRDAGNRRSFPDYLKVYPSLFFGGSWPRLAAWFIDILVAKALVRILVNTPLVWVGYVWESKGMHLYTVLAAIVFYAYFVLTTYYNRGQTIGKMILGLRVVSQDGEPLTLLQVLVRELCCRYIVVKFVLLSLFIVFHPQKRSLGDIFADTYVLSEKALSAHAFGRNEEKTPGFI